MWSKISTALKNKPQTGIHEEPSIDRLNESHKPSSSIPPSIKRNSKSSGPILREIFSTVSADNLDVPSSLSNVPCPDSSDLFDASHQLHISSFQLSGLDFDVNAPMFSLDLSTKGHSQFLPDGGNNHPNQMTLTSYQPGDLEDAIENEESQELSVQITALRALDETIFHAKAKSPKLPPPLHERNQSFSFGQPIFYSMATEADRVVVESSAEYKPASSESQQAPSTPTSAKTRTRSMSDTVDQTMLRSSCSQPRQVKADIDDGSTTGIVVCSRSTSGPDSFTAHADTYYTPQTMISATPSKGTLKHARKASKEESLIITLQTQLALQTELCGRYAADLKARDEFIGVMGEKLTDLEKNDTKHKNTLRSWKKKTQEVERVCRQLEETIEDLRQENMERSVIDEASGEALRMLHDQIASLHREKYERWKREQGLREEVETLEILLKDRPAKASEQTEALEKEIANLTAECDVLKADVKELETRTSAMEIERNKSENKDNELETELQEVWNLKDALEKERDELKDACLQAQDQVAHLGHDLQERDHRMSELEQERQFTNDNVTRFEENLRTRDAEIFQVTQRVLERESEVENLHEEMKSVEREYAHLINEQTRALRLATDQADESKARVDQLLRAKIEADVEVKTYRDRVIVLKEEVERLRRHVHSFQQESADKEVKIIHLTKQYSSGKEDLQGLNVVLDSKLQQLVESKNDVKDTAGITPAKPSKVAHSRHSSIFTAIPVPSRPSSVFPDSGTDTTHIPKKEMASLLTKPLALGRSTRVNGSRSSSVLSSANKPVVLAGVEGSVMGPPPLKSRPSIVGTPTPPVSFSHSSLARPTFHRRVSSVNSEHKVKTKISRTIVNASPAPSVLEQDEKENVDNASSRRRSMIPTLA